MATNLNIDPKLIDEVLRVSKKKTKREAVTFALEEYLAQQAQERLVKWFGKVDYLPGTHGVPAEPSRRRTRKASKCDRP